MGINIAEEPAAAIASIFRTNESRRDLKVLPES
jgi:hypothetical protein